MKLLRRIQNIAIVVSMITAVAIADGTDVTRKDLWSCIVILILVVIMIMYRALNEEKKEEVTNE